MQVGATHVRRIPQMRERQSSSTAQGTPSGQPAQPPPQSVPVSPPFWTRSSQLDAASSRGRVPESAPPGVEEAGQPESRKAKQTNERKEWRCISTTYRANGAP